MSFQEALLIVQRNITFEHILIVIGILIALTIIFYVVFVRDAPIDPEDAPEEPEREWYYQWHRDEWHPD